jgi:regulator of protease activity HflC (stomatin/prohibitin superfamily)
VFSIVLIVVLALVAAGLAVAGRRAGRGRLLLGAVAAGVLAVVVLGLSTTYTQDVGEAVVLRSVTGELAGQSTEPGLHLKAPWVETIVYDTRNNTISYIGDGETNHAGGSAQGPQITFQDREGVTGNMDIVVRYSIVPGAVSDLYSEFATQEDFVERVLANDIRSLSRDVPASYGTLEVFTQRPAIATAIREALTARWERQGVTVEEVSLQEIRYSDQVKTRFDEAQAARIAVDQARAEQEQARVAAETQAITATGQADANRILNASPTVEQVLRQRYIDALAGAERIYVVPEGANPMVEVQPGG